MHLVMTQQNNENSMPLILTDMSYSGQGFKNMANYRSTNTSSTGGEKLFDNEFTGRT